jgi:hypothetical protein
MAGSDPKDAAIPDWQRQPPSTTTASEQPESESKTSREDLLAQANKFLEDETIRNTSTDRKIAFLESKGLRNDEIVKLLGIQQTVTETSETASEKTSSPQKDSLVTKPSNHSFPSPEIQSSTASTPPAPSPKSATSTRDIPPVITYPEFLLQQSKPPLITFRNLLYTIYGVFGVGTSVYAVSEFLVKPMVQNLTITRHELAQTAGENLIKLNEKLEQNVSQIPPYTSHKSTNNRLSKNTGTDDENETPDAADSESITSDPTELYHRDVATQTSSEFDNHTPVPITLNDSVDADRDTTLSTSKSIATIRTHSSRLDLIAFQLRQRLDDDKRSKVADDVVMNHISDLQKYLDDLSYNSNPSYLSNSVFNMSTSGSFGKNSNSSKEDDAIASFRAEIRSVKGALLSAKNFPSGRSAVRPIGMVGHGGN